MPKELFTPASFGTLTGLIGVTYVVTVGLARATGFRPAWLGLAVGIACSEFGIYLASSGSLTDYLIGIGNGFLVYLAAGGVSGITDAGGKAIEARELRPQSVAPADGRQRLWANWF